MSLLYRTEYELIQTQTFKNEYTMEGDTITNNASEEKHTTCVSNRVATRQFQNLLCMIMVIECNMTMVVNQLHVFIEYNRIENKLLMRTYLGVNP